MNDLYEALEICLQDIDKGADVESVLFRYPDLANELRPILEASAGAKSMAVAAPSAEVVRRNRAKVLQHAAELRESKGRSSQRLWFASLRRVAVTLVVLTTLFVSGTGLVGASSNTLPGDNLYPVKRTWEGLRLFFTFNGQERETLELEHENERVYELNELLKEGRSTEVRFNGLVKSQDGHEWVVAGVRVLISAQTDIRDAGIIVGSPVEIRGITQANGTVLAERIRLLSSDAKLPEMEVEHEFGEDNENNSGPGSGEEHPTVEETETPDNENGNENESSGRGNNSGSNENGNSGHGNNESNENSGNENENRNENEGNENSNENGGQEGNENGNEEENGNHSGGEENSGSSGGGSEEGGGEED
jgi:hypothetical protein